ncbi:hypothetical protein HK098_007827 [Nowakowskiella sp. JEL0407]|nr:hypothetical protein HK098_007827 [Nowakowskiella sp. JEL0407]
MIDSIRKNSPGDKFVKSEKPSNEIDDVYEEVCLSFDSFKNQHPNTFWYLMSLAGLEPDSIIHKYVMESFEQFKESWQHW